MPASRNVMRAPSWWRDLRTPIAFLVAPLAIPIVMTWLRPSLADLDTGLALVVSMLAAYIGIFVIGLPIYLYLQTRGAMAFWLAPIIGFMIGVVMTYALYFFVALSVGYHVVSPAEPVTLQDAFGFGGPSGAVVGAILWLIARPDRREE
jgi:Zn-dependent protease with chaperone function